MQRERLKLVFAFFLFFVTLSLLGFSLNSSALSSFPLDVLQPETQAQQAIDVAQTAINMAYADLALADSAGTDISDLINTLNNAILELTQARVAYDNANYSFAISLAENAENIASSVSEQAQVRRFITIAQIQAQIIIAIVVIVITTFITYFALTRFIRYRRQKQREFLRMEIRLPDKDEEGRES